MNGKVYDLDAFFQTTNEDLEKKITSTISDTKIVSILEGRKHLCPFLVHLSFKTCTRGNETPSQYQKALEGAVSIELVRTASLVHKDIINKETRVKSNFHIERDIDNAILTGHRMLAIGFNIALKQGEEIAKLYVDTWNEALDGELKEVNFNKKDTKNNPDEVSKSKIFAEYEQIIGMKTAILFSSACKAGAIEANMSGDILKVFADYGREIGLAYQLADDLVDLAKGKSILSPILLLLIRLDNHNIYDDSFKEKKFRKKFNKNSSETKELFICEIKRHVINAKELSKSEIISLSPYRDLLTEAPAYIINKMLKEIKIAI